MKFKRILSLFTQDITRKSIALVLACLTWFFITRSINETQVFHDIPVEITGTGNSTYIDSRDKIRISLSIRGPGTLLSSLKSSDIKVLVPLPPLNGQNKINIRLTPKMIRLPQGLRTEDILTSQLQLDLDEIVTKSLPVKLLYQNRLHKDFLLESEPKVNPQKLRVTGPRRQLDSLHHLVTDPLNIAPHHKRSYRTIANITAPAELKLNTQHVSVDVTVRPYLTRRTLLNIPIQIIQQKGKYFAEPMPTADVEVTGSPADIAKLRKTDIIVFVNPAEQKAKDPLPLHFWCSMPNIRLIRLSPEKTVAPEASHGH